MPSFLKHSPELKLIVLMPSNSWCLRKGEKLILLWSLFGGWRAYLKGGGGIYEYSAFINIWIDWGNRTISLQEWAISISITILLVLVTMLVRTCREGKSHIDHLLPNTFYTVVSFLYLLETSENVKFSNLTFSGGIEMEHQREMG